MSRVGGRLISVLVLLILINMLPVAPGIQGEMVTGEPTGTRGTIVVNASGGGDYTHIQWAVDNASEGDTVYVEAGAYEENIEVNKTLSLIGDGRDNTIIDGGNEGTVLSITADGVSLTGFKIINSEVDDEGAGWIIYGGIILSNVINVI